MKVHVVERHKRDDNVYPCVLCGKQVVVGRDNYELLGSAKLGTREVWCMPDAPIAVILDVMCS